MYLYIKCPNKFEPDRLRTKNLNIWKGLLGKALLEDNEVYTRMPTGSGDSLVFQLPAKIKDTKYLSLVLYPLRTLQAYNATALNREGFKSRSLNWILHHLKVKGGE